MDIDDLKEKVEDLAWECFLDQTGSKKSGSRWFYAPKGPKAIIEKLAESVQSAIDAENK